MYTLWYPFRHPGPPPTNAPLLGVYLAISGTNLALLRKQKYNLLLSYSIVQLAITTLYFAVSLYAAPAQSLAIFNIVGSYGPNALSPWPSVIVNVAFVLNTWISDAFLVRIPCARHHTILNRALALSMLHRLHGEHV